MRWGWVRVYPPYLSDEQRVSVAHSPPEDLVVPQSHISHLLEGGREVQREAYRGHGKTHRKT